METQERDSAADSQKDQIGSATGLARQTLKQSPSLIRASLITLAPAADRSPRAVDLVGDGEHLAGRFAAKSILAGQQPTPAGGRGTPPAMG